MSTAVLSKANQVFPWLKHLPSKQVDEFYTDFFNALEQAIQDKDWAVLEQVVESWQATAELLADPELTTILTSPSEDDWEDWNDVEAELLPTSQDNRVDPSH